MWKLSYLFLFFPKKKKEKDITECLALLFELSFSTFGKAYSFEKFTETKEYFLQELRTIGLVFMKTVNI